MTVSQATDRAAINNRLAQDGIRARIVPLRQDCSTPLNMPWRYPKPSTQPWATKGNTNRPAGSWRMGIIPSLIPAGHTLVFTLQEWHHRDWESASEIFEGAPDRDAAPQRSGFTISYR